MSESDKQLKNEMWRRVSDIQEIDFDKLWFDIQVAKEFAKKGSTLTKSGVIQSLLNIMLSYRNI